MSLTKPKFPEGALVTTVQGIDYFITYEGGDGNDIALYSNFAVGDVNQDGLTNLLDVQPFIDAIGSGTYIYEADANGDGFVNLLDVAPFIALLANLRNWT